MAISDNSQYDAVIIGAGIGGLVCGCCLAQAGMKVLIAEQHFRIGGYCTSFKRKRFTFDAAAHSFGGYRRGGVVEKIFSTLGVERKIQITHYQPSDTIRSSDHEISFWDDIRRTTDDFCQAFPKECNNIRNFFNFIIESRSTELIKLRHATFQEFMDSYFLDVKLKTILSFPLFGNGGLPPSLLSAFAGIKLFSEFLLDGGYYPTGGMQCLADGLGAIFTEAGGILRLSCEVQKITVRGNIVEGVVLGNGEQVFAHHVISDCDARHTFTVLLGEEHLPADFSRMLDGLLPSSSLFVGYLGIDGQLDSLPHFGSNFWFIPHYDLEGAYNVSRKYIINRDKEFMLRVSPDAQTLLVFLSMQFNDKFFWSEAKEHMLDSLIDLVEARLIPGLSRHILHKEAATPYTMYRYTRNYRGAAYGWASTPTQFLLPNFRVPSFIKGLYLAGHWASVAQGIPGVVYTGSETARTVLRRQSRVQSLP